MSSWFRQTIMPDVSRKVDVSRLTDAECSHVIDVISKDIKLRKFEQERIDALTKKLEDYRRSILLADLSRSKKRLPLDDYCMCGRNLFTFCLFVSADECISCETYCCSKCRKLLVYEGENGREEYYLCKLCARKRDLKRKCNSWFYDEVDRRFKRFGSSKVLRAIYKQNETIEPRLITLLAICRELQPAKRESYRLRTMDSSYASSFSESEYFPGLFKKRSSLGRKHCASESDVQRIKGRRGSKIFLEDEDVEEPLDQRDKRRNRIKSVEVLPNTSEEVVHFELVQT